MKEIQLLTVQMCGLKCKSKMKCTIFLFLMLNFTSIKLAYHKHIKEIVTDRKVSSFLNKYYCWLVYNHNLLPYNLIQIEGLILKSIIGFAKIHFDLKNYMSDDEWPRTPDRQWVWNISKSFGYCLYSCPCQDKINFLEILFQENW